MWIRAQSTGYSRSIIVRKGHLGACIDASVFVCAWHDGGSCRLASVKGSCSLADCIEVGVHSLLLLSNRSLHKLVIFTGGIILQSHIVHVAGDARVGPISHVHRLRTILLSTLDQGYRAVYWLNQLLKLGGWTQGPFLERTK